MALLLSPGPTSENWNYCFELPKERYALGWICCRIATRLGLIDYVICGKTCGVSISCFVYYRSHCRVVWSSLCGITEASLINYVLYSKTCCIGTLSLLEQISAPRQEFEHQVVDSDCHYRATETRLSYYCPELQHPTIELPKARRPTIMAGIAMPDISRDDIPFIVIMHTIIPPNLLLPTFYSIWKF